MTDTHLSDSNHKFNFHLFDLLADHKSIFINVIKEKKAINKSILPTSFQMINHNKIIESKLIANANSTNVDSFLMDIKKIIDDNLVTIKIRSNHDKPYINHEIANLIKIRNNYYKMKDKYPHCIDIHKQYKEYRNKIARLIKKSKKDFLDKYFQENSNDPRKIWMQLKAHLYNKYNSRQSCELIVDNGIAISNKTNIANKFNDYFISKTHELIATNSIDEEEFHQFHSLEIYNNSKPITNCTSTLALLIRCTNDKSCVTSITALQN